jgi:Protein of unknown function (DUF669)
MTVGLDLDFGGVGGGFEPLPDGNYTLKVADCPVKENKAKDGRMIVFEFDVMDDDFVGRKLWLNTSLKPAARWKLQEVLEAITQQEWREDGMELELTELLGEIVTAEVFTEEYDGKPVNRINRLYPYKD